MHRWEYEVKKSSKLICGVASSMAKQFDWSTLGTRIVWGLCLVFAPLTTAIVYLVLAQFVYKNG
ncbi:PspC domain-containing protein [Shewanella sp. 202IG2-18]|uniref:PspC domain-containing protein n=1 Tax=Parashewanella hymeniacidonis TaxID=2807618 RepID=UPI001961EAFD|nr:PspC domain-containing protein [Parashewanella hymeniacidonis]MBM7070693.1 PspC domain-containing protein [Parashewanella hymeniacidonis]